MKGVNKVLLLFLTAALIDVVIYPDLFITFHKSFTIWADYSTEFPLTFVLTNMFYQGGLQLWNYFGQVPFFHTYAVLGLFKFPNVVTALAYRALEPFSTNSAALFHHVFVWGNMMTLLLIRVAGIFLLLKTVTRNRSLLMVSTVFFAVFFSQLAFIRGICWMSYFPLGMYLVVRFFQEGQWRYLAGVVVFLTIGMGSGVLNGGYLYLPMHFFIIAGIVWVVIDGRRGFMTRLRPFPWKQALGIAAIGVLIMAPYLYIDRFGFPDLAFDETNSRLNHVFSPSWYFHHLSLGLGAPQTFLTGMLDMGTLDISKLYEGWVFLFLALAGVVLSRQSLKYFFACAIIFLWLLSFPREGFNPGLIAHWINALTNPFKVIPRGYVTACQAMLPYLIMPLAVMGVEAILELLKERKLTYLELRILGVMVLVLVISSVLVLPRNAQLYLLSAAVLTLAALTWVYYHHSRRAKYAFAAVLCVLGLLDIFFIIHQTRMQLAQFDRRPAVLSALPNAGLVGYDEENPSIFPYRYTYALHFSYQDESSLWFPYGVSSDVHHVVNQALNFVFLNGYAPRHTAFESWRSDRQMIDYLRGNNQFMFLAGTAINASPDGLEKIADAGLNTEVIEVEDPQHQLRLPDQWPVGLKAEEEHFQYDHLTLSPGGKRHLQDGLMIYTWALPADFPSYLATSYFPAEASYLRFFAGNRAHRKEFQSAEGQLIRPDTFDVQNINKGTLNAAFPANDPAPDGPCALLYPSHENQGVQGLREKHFDDLGLIYRAPRDGWLLVHEPFDRKWSVTVDGHPVDYYRADKSFIAFPLFQGDHHIRIQYWPRSPLRLLLLISAIMVSLGLPLLILLALRWEEVI